MRIIELVENIEQIDEIDSASVGNVAGKIGKGIGGAIGGAIGAAQRFGKDFKQGYSGAKTSASTGTPVNDIPSQIAQKKQEIAALEKQLKAPTQPGIGQATNPVAAVAGNTPAQPAAAPAETPPTEPGIGQAAGSVQATSSNTAPAANQPAVKRNPNNPDDLGFGFDVDTGLPLKSQAEKDANMAKADAAEKAAATAQQPAAPAATTPVTAPAGGKMTQAQQAAMKAKLQGKRAAGQTTASQTGSGFKDYVGGSQNKIVVNPDGSTSLKKLQRESLEFYSNFLGRNL
jgi:hypothetical protein